MKKIFLLGVITICIGQLFSQVPDYVSTNGLIGWYPFTGNPNDIGGHSLNGVINGGVTLTTDRCGNPNSSYHFDGRTGFISVGSDSLLTLTIQYSISGWFLPDTILGNQRTIISQSKNSTQTGLCLNLDHLQDYRLVCDNTDGNGVHLISSDSLPYPYQWYFSVVTYDGDSLKLYINGELDTTMLYNINLSTNLHILTIGSQNLVGTTDFFSGKIDDIGIWNRSLTLQEVQRLYTPLCRSTCTSTIYDTVHISTTDTLIINTPLTGINPPNNTNTLEVYPNPTSDHVYINTGNYSTMNGYTIKIVNTLGQTEFQNVVNQQLFDISLSGWSHGTYLIEILNNSNTIIETKFIVLQ